MKSTENDTYSFRGGSLDRLRRASTKLGYPLVFAVRFVKFRDYVVWVIVNDHGRSENIRVELSNLVTGIRGDIWNDQFYVLEKNITIEFHYDPTFEETGMRAPDGSNFGRILINGGDHILKVEGIPAALAAHVLSSFNLELVQQKPQGTTTIHEFRPMNKFTTVVDMLYNLNRFFTDEFGNRVYDPPLILARADQETELPLLERRYRASCRLNVRA